MTQYQVTVHLDRGTRLSVDRKFYNKAHAFHVFQEIVSRYVTDRDANVTLGRVNAVGRSTVLASKFTGENRVTVEPTFYQA